MTRLPKLIWAVLVLNSARLPVLIAQAGPRSPSNSAVPATATPSAQAPDRTEPAPVQFEVASIRPVGGGSLRARFRMDAGLVEIAGVSLQELMEYAFRLQQEQVDGPEWLHYHRGPHFDISAKLPQGATLDQVPEMLKALLVERFKLVYHLEHREQNVDALVAGKGALKLEQVSLPAPAPPAEPPSASGSNAAAIIRTINGRLTRVNSSTNGLADSDGYVHTDSRDTIHWDFASTTMGGLAEQLAEELQRPVRDMTGLKGRYHVLLDVSIPQFPPRPPGAMSRQEFDDEMNEMRNHFSAALQKLGLQLEMRKAPIEYVVADRVEQAPTDN